MTIQKKIRAIASQDISALKTIIETNDLFPPDLLDEIMSDYLHSENSKNQYWFTYEEEKTLAIGYCAPEKMTEGTWNLYLIAVHSEHQGRGIGTAMMKYIERELTLKRERILLVETSSLASFAKTRQFYLKCGYQEEARIREFYQAGEDKVVFRKVLSDL